MNLKTAKRLSDIICVMFVIVWIVDRTFPDLISNIVFWVIMVVLFILLLIIDLKFMRCPHCGAQVTRWGGHYCSSCGKDLDK